MPFAHFLTVECLPLAVLLGRNVDLLCFYHVGSAGNLIFEKGGINDTALLKKHLLSQGMALRHRDLPVDLSLDELRIDGKAAVMSHNCLDHPHHARLHIDFHFSYLRIGRIILRPPALGRRKAGMSRHILDRPEVTFADNRVAIFFRSLPQSRCIGDFSLGAPAHENLLVLRFEISYVRVQFLGSNFQEFFHGALGSPFCCIPCDISKTAYPRADVLRRGLRVSSEYLDIFHGNRQFLRHDLRENGLGALADIERPCDQRDRCVLIQFHDHR